MSKRASIALAVIVCSALLLAFLFIRHIAGSSSRIVPTQNVGPEIAARNLFEQSNQFLGVPLYRDVRTRVLAQHWSCATVEVDATMVLLTRAGVKWVDTPCEVDCVFSEGRWQCRGLECYRTAYSRMTRHLVPELKRKGNFITDIGLYSLTRRGVEGGTVEEDVLRRKLDDAAALIASHCYELDDVANPHLTARLIADYAGRYGFSVQDIQNLDRRHEVEFLLEAGDY